MVQTAKTAKQQYKELTAKMRVTAIIEDNSGEIAGELVRVYESAEMKHRWLSSKILFILEDFDGEIEESVDVPDSVDESAAVTELINRTRESLSTRGIKFPPLDDESFVPTVNLFLRAFENCATNSYSLLETVY